MKSKSETWIDVSDISGTAFIEGWKTYTPQHKVRTFYFLVLLVGGKSQCEGKIRSGLSDVEHFSLQ